MSSLIDVYKRQVYGGLLFIGIYLGILFLMATVLIIYYKQISEGYEDRERYQICLLYTSNRLYFRYVMLMSRSIIGKITDFMRTMRNSRSVRRSGKMWKARRVNRL